MKPEEKAFAFQLEMLAHKLLQEAADVRAGKYTTRQIRISAAANITLIKWALADYEQAIDN